MELDMISSTSTPEERDKSVGDPAERHQSIRGAIRDSARGTTRDSIRHSLRGQHVQKVEDLKTVFVDAAAMKEKVRHNLSKPTKSVTDLYKDTGLCQKIARHQMFGNITLTVIGMNALWLAVDTDLNNAAMLLDAHPAIQVVEHMFCSYFFFELCVRFVAFKWKRDCIKDPWFAFDAGLVLLMVLETWVMSVVMLGLSSSGGASGLPNAGVMKVARLFRLSRMARMARLLRSIPELMIMLKGMAAACRSVFFTLCLLGFLTYVFAIAFKQLTEGTRVGEVHFSSVVHSMYSLLLFGTLLDNVGLLTGRLGGENIVYAALLFLFILLAAYTVLNMLVGVLCEVVTAVAATEKEEMLVLHVNRKVKAIVDELDKDGDNCISKSEFVKILENSDAVQSLQDVGVDVVGLVDFADVIFEDGAQGLSFEKFMDIVLQLRGTNTATVKDIVELRKMVRTNNIQTSHLLARIEGRILSQVSKCGNITPTLSTASFDSADLDKLGLREPSEGILGIVTDSFPMPPFSSTPAMFMHHDADIDSLPSVDNVRDAGSCTDSNHHMKTPVDIKAHAAPAKVKRMAPTPEILPEVKGQWTPCRPGEGMHVCRAMLEHISIIGKRPATQPHASPTHCGPMPGLDENCVNMDWVSANATQPTYQTPWCSTALQEKLRAHVAALEKLLSTSLCESGQAGVLQQKHGNPACELEAVLSKSAELAPALAQKKSFTLPTCDVCAGGLERLPSNAASASLTYQAGRQEL